MTERLAARTIAFDEAEFLQRRQNIPEIAGIMGQHIGFERARTPVKAPFAVRDRP